MSKNKRKELELIEDKQIIEQASEARLTENGSLELYSIVSEDLNSEDKDVAGMRLVLSPRFVKKLKNLLNKNL